MPDPNLFTPVFDQETARGPYRWKRALVGRQAGASRLGASVFEVPPGGATFPYHAHHANEELLLVEGLAEAAGHAQRLGQLRPAGGVRGKDDRDGG